MESTLLMELLAVQGRSENNHTQTLSSPDSVKINHFCENTWIWYGFVYIPLGCDASRIIDFFASDMYMSGMTNKQKIATLNDQFRPINA